MLVLKHPAPPVATKMLSIALPAPIHARLGKLAAAAGLPLSTYARMLLEAACAARTGTTGDVALDDAVGRVALLFGAEFDLASVARLTGLHPATCDLIWSAWRAEMARIAGLARAAR